jgi:hypothetical protein
MAMTIFAVLNGMGVAFLVYVLIQFWKEGRRLHGEAPRRQATEFSSERKAEVAVVTYPVSRSTQIGLSVVPFPARGRDLKDRQVHPARR